jgi:methyl-accepting chemotaxis protein
MAVQKMQEAGELVREQEKSVELTKATFGQITEAIKESVQFVEMINGSSQKIEENKNSVLNNIETLSAVAQQNAASTQQASAAIEEQTASVEDIAHASESLAGMAQDLQGMIEKFRI